MPRYTFYNKRTKKEWVDYMTIAEMESYLEKNKHIHQVLQPINIVSGVQGITHKTDGGWNDNLNRIEREAYETGNILFRNWEDSIKNQ